MNTRINRNRIFEQSWTEILHMELINAVCVYKLLLSGGAVTILETTLFVGIVAGRVIGISLFTRLNFGQVPTMSETGFAIWGSLSILGTMRALVHFVNL